MSGAAFDHRELRTVGQIVAESAVLTRATLYRWLSEGEGNGLRAAVVTVGARIYLHRPTFNAWLESRMGCRRSSGPELGEGCGPRRQRPRVTVVRRRAGKGGGR